VKREKLRIEHEKNLLEIQMKQLEDLHQKRLADDETR